MTNEEAREILHQIRMQKCVTECDYSCKLYESETFCLEEKALDMAIKALKQTDTLEKIITQIEQVRDKDKLCEYPYNRCINIIKEEIKNENNSNG